MSWDVILPFLQPIAGLIHDPEISDIMVNGPDRVFVEKFGEIRAVPGVKISEKALQVAIRNIARVLGDDINEQNPTATMSKLMQTDPTETDVASTVTKGLPRHGTRWARAQKPTTRELIREERNALQ